MPGLDDTSVSDVSLPSSNIKFLLSASYGISGKLILTVKDSCKLVGRVTDWQFEGWGMVITTEGKGQLYAIGDVPSHIHQPSFDVMSGN